ncbi:MAG: hypothetical protein BWY04_01067 [candidate division CPR1 bacterium ADurb.Bin160]|uniref:Uncharacterized protein n=1 Tax=candidate division CPR1 bacterium ADurb.Bin160 TaxID=1852826 RepID=A0A1V5ZLC4_9BACT|nr:MAG: hypothetical protein BWY04_01067 [candidate division CPR1 bacterium ADurb.Bin160]
MSYPKNSAFIPELQYWFSVFSRNESKLNKTGVGYCNIIPRESLPEDSFIELLFNENWKKFSYSYKYKRIENKQYWPFTVRTRLSVYSNFSRYFISGKTSEFSLNIFNLHLDDILLLNKLLEYRLVFNSMIPEREFPFWEYGRYSWEDYEYEEWTDTTSYLWEDIFFNILFEDLETPLSKLIFLYLDFKIYGNFENYNNDIIISDVDTPNHILCKCFELFLLDTYFKNSLENVVF